MPPAQCWPMVADCTGLLPQVKVSTVSFQNGGVMVGLHLPKDLPAVGAWALKARERISGREGIQHIPGSRNKLVRGGPYRQYHR